MKCKCLVPDEIYLKQTRLNYLDKFFILFYSNLSIYLSIPIYLSVYLSQFISINMSVSVSFFLFISVCSFLSFFFYLPIYIYIYVRLFLFLCLSLYIYIYIMSRYQHGYPRPSLTTSPYLPLLPTGVQCYIPYQHIAAVCRFELVVHVKWSTGVHHLRAHPYFSSSVPHVWFI